MDPVTLGLMGGGLVLGAYGDWMASRAEAEAEARNADFYREQAEFARKAGVRQRMIFARQSKVLLGEQAAGIAKSGGGQSSLFLATQDLFRQQEEGAIQEETDFNVRLARLRAEHSQSRAEMVGSKTNFWLRTAGRGLSGASSVL